MNDLGDRKIAIINADDLGFSTGITEGIFGAHRQGVVTSTTLAANMPAAEAAVKALADVPQLGVGVHLNCTQGPALSEQGRRLLAGPEGVMNWTAGEITKAAMLRRGVLDAIEAEFDAQIRRAMDLGVKPTHVDSHRHSHAFGPIFSRVVKLARRYDIPFVRRHREYLPGAGWPEAPAKQRRVRTITNVLGYFNARRAGEMFCTSGTWGIAHTGLIDADWLATVAQRLPAGEAVEIMVHPGLPSADLDPSSTRLLESRQKELAALCDAKVKESFQKNGVMLANYGNIRSKSD